MFYGTDINIGDLPVPRETHHEWALLHEESPKNVYLYSHAEMMELFNITSTFKYAFKYTFLSIYFVIYSRYKTRRYSAEVM